MPATFRATVAWPLTPVRGKARTAGKTAFSRPSGNRKRGSGAGFLTADTPLKSRLLRARLRSCAKRHVEAARRVLRSWPHRRQRRDQAARHLTILGGDIRRIGRSDGTGVSDRGASVNSAPSSGQAAGTRLRLIKRSGASERILSLTEQGCARCPLCCAQQSQERCRVFNDPATPPSASSAAAAIPGRAGAQHIQWRRL